MLKLIDASLKPLLNSGMTPEQSRKIINKTDVHLCCQSFYQGDGAAFPAAPECPQNGTAIDAAPDYGWEHKKHDSTNCTSERWFIQKKRWHYRKLEYTRTPQSLKTSPFCLNTKSTIWPINYFIILLFTCFQFTQSHILKSKNIYLC